MMERWWDYTWRARFNLPRQGRAPVQAARCAADEPIMTEALMIEVNQIGDGDPLEFEVMVREASGESRHHVTMSENCHAIFHNHNLR
jgi:hypothetical protein